MTHTHPHPGSALGLALPLLLALALPAQNAASRPATSRTSAWSEAQQRGFAYLVTQQKDGVFEVKTKQGSRPDLGLSALALAALQSKPRGERSADEAATIAKGLAWLASQQEKDGSIGTQLSNYNTCTSMLALAKSGDPRYADALAKAQRFIVALQHAEQRGFAPSDPDYGSIGYGREGRGDLSNLAFAVEALRASGLSEKDEALVRATAFLQRTQNLRATNDVQRTTKDETSGATLTIVSGDDGGAAYYPGSSPMGYAELGDGKSVPRSYGSMTYALLKTYLLAGVPAGDARVRAAVAWITKNWTLEENPGADPKLPEKTKFEGLYYQYLMMAKALDLAGIETLRVERGGAPVDVAWRSTLRKQLLGLQKPDGSWVNDKNDRWWEGMPVIVTAYALLALEHT